MFVFRPADTTGARKWRSGPLVSDKHELPKNVEGYLAALSKLYARAGRRELQEIIVNATVRIVGKRCGGPTLFISFARVEAADLFN